MKIQSIGNDYSVNRSVNNRVKNNQTTFGRTWEEHISWGANYIKQKGKTNFKLFSFPDARAVFVEIADKAAKEISGIKDRIVCIAGVAGAGVAINNITPKDEDSKIYPMKNNGNGIFEANNISAKPDDKYRFIVVTKDNQVNLVKDPYAKKQEDINGWSSVYSSNYEWKNTDWLKCKDPRRIVRNPSQPLRGLDRLVIDEINIPTMSDEGTFDAAKSNIDKIADKRIATAIELLPVENTYSMQWGYDGVDKFAVNEKLGGADKLKELIDYAHGKGLNVIMDMVPNHMGPDGDYLPQTGPYEKGPGEFGGEFNYEGQNNRYVRDWMANAALNWAGEYKVDGIRLDMTKLCGSDYLLKQIVAEVNEHFPNVFIIAEDGRDNKESVTRYPEEAAVNGHEDNLEFIDTGVDFIANRKWRSTPGDIGFDSEWDFPFMHILKKALLEPGSNLLSSLDDKLKSSQHRVKYVMSHDEIGNEDGTRLMVKVIGRHLNLFGNVNGYSDAEKGQRAAHAAQKLAELIITEDFGTMTKEELWSKEQEIGLNNFISKVDLCDAFNTAIAKQKLANGTIFTVPGPKMYFQGDEVADLSYFKFFREFSGEKYQRAQSDDLKNSIIAKKGYDTLEEIARPDSIVGKTNPKGIYKEVKNQMRSFNADLRTLIDKNQVLRAGNIVATYNDNNHNVHIHQLKLGADEVLVIKNFGHGFHDKNYEYYGFPQNSNWKEIFSSDEKQYGGSGYNNQRKEPITNTNQKLSLAPYSFIILKKV